MAADEEGEDYELSDVEEAEHPERPRDSKVDEARGILLETPFAATSESVLYGQQIETVYEESFFHWITARALSELAKERKVNAVTLPLGEKTNIRFYASARNRYFMRRAKAVIRLVQEFADPAFTEALGRHGELMFSAALAAAGFMPVEPSAHMREESGPRPDIIWTSFSRATASHTGRR
jgi:hypothetical protein